MHAKNLMAVFACLCASLSIGAAAQTPVPEISTVFAAGKVAGNQYTNDYFGLTLTTIDAEFTKGGFIVGVGGGEGVLILRGKRYPFTVSGMSVGFTIGASTTKFVGRALNLKGPASIEGSYAAGGAGGAIAAGAGAVQLQNGNGVILQLSGPKVGAEVSAAVGGVTIRLK